MSTPGGHIQAVGIDRSFTLRDPSLARVIVALRGRRHGDDALLAYRDRNGWRNVHADDINERLRETVGEEFSGKDLRTWNATVLAAVTLAGHNSARSSGACRGEHAPRALRPLRPP